MSFGARLLILIAACGSPTAPPPAPRDQAPVKHAAPDAGAPPAYVGVVTAAESVDIAPRFEGVLASVAVRPGDTVTAGQVVAEMDRKTMQEELRAAQAALGAAVAAHRAAEVDVEGGRRKVALETDMVGRGIEPKVNLDEAVLALKKAQAAAQKTNAAVAQESSHVQTARDHLADLALRAPSEGTVAMRFKDPGATVGAGTAIVRIVGHGGLRLKFAVPPDQARALSPGATVRASIDTISKPLAATIRQVSPALDPSSGMILVEAELAADDATARELRPGLAARVH